MTIQLVRERKAKAFKGLEDIMAKSPEGKLDADQKRQYDAFFADLKEAKEDEQRILDFQEMQAQQRGNRAQQREQEERQNRNTGDESPADIKKKKRQAFVQYLRGGFNAINPELRNYYSTTESPFDTRGTDSQKTTPDSAGGYLIDSELASEIQLGEIFVSDMERACTVITTQTGNIINFPKIDDTGTDGSLSSEASRDSADIAVSDMTVGNTAISSYLYHSGWVTMSMEAARDIEYSLNSWLLPQLGQRCNRAKNAHLTTGTGTNQPKGIVTAATSGKTAASATAITHGELMDLFRSVDKAYRDNPKSAWMCNDAIEGSIIKLGLTAAQDFNPVEVRNNGDVYIMGKRVYSNKDMASSLAANNKVLLFGDFGQYIIRKVANPSILFTDQAFIKRLQYGYLGYERLDANFVGATNSIKYLQMASA